MVGDPRVDGEAGADPLRDAGGLDWDSGLTACLAGLRSCKNVENIGIKLLARIYPQDLEVSQSLERKLLRPPVEQGIFGAKDWLVRTLRTYLKVCLARRRRSILGEQHIREALVAAWPVAVGIEVRRGGSIYESMDRLLERLQTAATAVGRLAPAAAQQRIRGTAERDVFAIVP